MRFEEGEQSENVDDQRGSGGGGGGGRMMIGGGGGMGLLVVALVVWLLGGNPMALLNVALRQGGQAPVVRAPGGAPDPSEEKYKKFSSAVLRDTELVWDEVFQKQLHQRYEPTTLTLFSGGVRSGCGAASSDSGPFYCPADNRVYLDLSFFQELEQRFAAAGDAAQAYVIAHEVGHHVQNLLGISDRVHNEQEAHRRRGDEKGANEWSVRLELQADFLAGVWVNRGNQARKILEPGDIDEALRCATAIGDDRLQKQARGSVRPDLFTHGTSAQRSKWLKRGLELGDITKANELFELPYNQL